jgi:diguanylate cyclase (GGDEF)-like protein
MMSRAADKKRVTLSDLHTVQRPRASAGTPRETVRDRVAAEGLRAQLPARAAIATLVVAVQYGLLALARGSLANAALVEVLAAYLAFVGLMRWRVARRGEATPAVVTIALAADIAFVFAVTAAGASPAHYERALLGTMIVIHVANFYFGRRQAWRAVVIGIIAYLVLIAAASARGLPVDRLEELWSLAVGIAGTMLVVTQAGHVRRRLHRIVELFERAEKGDFSQSYDEDADRRPDAITRVGRAYNRVREQLASMVLTDSLTGCLNRRGFEQAYAREVSRSRRAGSELALLVLDLDHFKQVNDTYGHLAGDEVLRDAGRLLIQAGRAGDIVARVGGEEFAVLLPDTGATGALHVATRMCDLMRAHEFPTATADGTPIRLTTSIGLATLFPPGAGDDSAAGLAARADSALYVSKRSGRDQVQSWRRSWGFAAGEDPSPESE